ncbi:MAG: alpha/beta hydrolase [Caldilinea sp.]|nr:alpha/beta fold hydrolase [Caldilinea sp.]MCB9114575.1 alpha/beta fold hydrolase [Caldilineaceae bacterium]MCO5210665.1 alpha/beta hydrolase [Caldilinea sp.]
MSTQYLSHHAGRIAYDDTGSGPLVLCAPSIGDVRAEYRFLTPHLLAAGFRVVTMDLRGHGESSTQWGDFSVAGVGSDMLALIRHLDGGPALIISTSMAAGAAAWAAVEASSLVAGIVMIGAAVHGEVSGANRLLYKALFARPWGVAFWQWYYTTLYPTRKPADFAAYKAALGANLKEKGRLEAMLAAVLAPKTASAERLERVTAPVLVLMGSKDPDFKQPEVEARWVADAVHGRYVMVDGAGHYPHAEMPEIAAPIIVDFLQTAVAAEEAHHVA